MKREIRLVQGMPVEIPLLDREGEEARMQLNKLARETYEQTGNLSGCRLREACTEFEEMAKDHLIMEDSTDSEEDS